MAAATADEISELLGDRTDETIVERIANVGATLDEISEAIEDLDYKAHVGVSREASSTRIAAVRTILEDLPPEEDLVPGADADEEDEHEGLTLVSLDELGPEP